jgi:hypothetical protein
MAFPSNVGSQQQSLDFVWAQIRAIVTNIKQTTSSVSTSVGAGCTADVILSYLAFLVNNKAQLDKLTAVSGIAQYAQTQINNPSFDVAGQYNTMATAIVNTGAWITGNFPATGGFIQPGSFNGDGSFSYRAFTASALAPLLSLMNSLLATID